MLPHPEARGPAPAARRTSPAVAHPPAWRRWRAAWTDAAYGPAGFWSHERPGDHFSTAVGVGPLVARTVAGLAPAGVGTVVDVGAGDGALLVALLGALPGVGLVGVDRRPRPPGLPAAVRWYEDHLDVDAERWERGGPAAWLAGPPSPGVPLVVAHEWLDDLPTGVAVRVGDVWREVEVDETGAERPGTPVADADRAWLDRWWPAPVGPDGADGADGADRADGARAEVGRTRDVAWAGLVAAAVARGGRALAVDYGHRAAERPVDGSLVAYAAGRQRRPVPDGSANLTAGVAVDALAAAGEAAGAATVLLGRQADVIADLPDDEPSDPLAALVRRSERQALTSPSRWGDLWWLLQGDA